MTNPTHAFDLNRAARALVSAAVGHTLDFHPYTESTMLAAQRLAQRPDIRSGAVVLADEQAAGRGRLQRRWEAPAGRALLLSILLKPGQLPPVPGHLPMLAGLAALDAIRAVAGPHAGGPGLGLKWPNDVVAGSTLHDARKLGGILIESAIENGRLSHAVVGIGLNVNQTAAEMPVIEPPALPPSGLSLEFGRHFDRTDLLIALCTAFADRLTHPAPMLVAEWRRELWTLGQPVTVHHPDGSTSGGDAVDVTAAGGLVVEQVDPARGSLRYTVDAGDVTLRAHAPNREMAPTADSGATRSVAADS